MNKVLVSIGLVICIIVASLCSSGTTTEISYTPRNEHVGCDTYAHKVFCLSNDYRVNEGLPRLIWNSELEKVSKARVDDMCKNNYFAHETKEYDWTREINSSLFDYTLAGENLAKGHKTPDEATKALIASPSHRENIVGRYTYSGVYTADCNGRILTAQTFAKP